MFKSGLISFGAVLVSLLFCLVSCKKEKESEIVELQLAVEQPVNHSDNQKVYLDNNRLVNWYVDNNEQIRINNGISTSTSQVINSTAKASGGTTYTAVYPATNSAGDDNIANNGSVTVTIPSVQKYKLVNINGTLYQDLHDLPMAAYLNTAENVPPVLMFRNLASLIKVTVKNSLGNIRISSIKIKSTNDVRLCGQYSCSLTKSTTKWIPTIPAPASTSEYYGDEVMLDFTNSSDSVIGSGATKNYYIVVPPITEPCSLRVDICCAKKAVSQPSKVYKKIYTQTLTVDRSTICSLSVTLNTTKFTEEGYFSVSSDSLVYFAPGNLQYYITGNKWYFAESTMNSVGSDSNVNRLMRQKDTIDLFNWASATKPADLDSAKIGSYSLNTITGNKRVISNNNFSWGSNITIYNLYTNVNDNYHKWYCLPDNQWRYLIDDRSGRRYVKARIRINGSYHNGLILFPDTYTHPRGIPLQNENTKSSSYSANTFSRVQWRMMEANGAVFLPTTGLRMSDIATSGWSTFSVFPVSSDYNIMAIGSQDATTGYYWSAGPASYGLKFEDDGTHSDILFDNAANGAYWPFMNYAYVGSNITNHNMYDWFVTFGFSVRLVIKK